MWHVGIDVGGTFTDLFGWNKSTGEQVTSKVITTRPDRSIGVMDALVAANINAADVTQLMHGTTTATNALLEREFPAVAMITTTGFRDTIEIARQHREHLYDPYQTKPKPIIKRRYRFTVDERIDAAGNIVRPLPAEQIEKIAETIRAHDIKAVAVGFINSYKNAEHEIATREILERTCPGVRVVLSAETRPVFREHGRFTTTAIRAATMPVMEQYFNHLEESLQQAGFTGTLTILKSSGGIAGIDYAKQHPEELIESGPAGGVAYAAYLNKLLESCPNIIHTDVGGTSFDVSIVENGKGLVTRDHEIEWEVPCIVPMLDIHSVGAGGGSVGWVDEGGSLRVGPLSAGSSPGPVCYGNGGTEPTITDANLLLGRIEPSLGGKMDLDRDAAERQMGIVADKVGLTTLETAEGMIRIGCEAMAQAVKKVLVSRGRDPRDFVYASFGGAGAMHACFVADSLNVPRVIVPAFAGVASAFGATAMDLRQDLEAFYFSPVSDTDVAVLNAKYAELEAEAIRRLEADGVSRSDIVTSRSAQMRYVGQTYEVETEVPSGELTAADLEAIVEKFHATHEREYGVSSTDFAPAFVSLGFTGSGKVESPPPLEITRVDDTAALKGTRQVYFEGEWHDTPVYNGHALGVDQRVAGPAIVEYEHACAVLPPWTSGHIDKFDNLIIDLAREKANNVSTPENEEVDPVTFEVLRSVFEYASDRMSSVLQRASFSPILADMVDFSNAIYDYDTQLLSQAANCPIHLAAMKYSAEAIIDHFGRDGINEGDVIVLNDPYKGGTHINDITFLSPILFEGELLGYSVSRGHWMDLGGGAAGGQAFTGTHIAGEGLRLPPTKIYEAGKPRKDIIAIIMNNTRTPHFVEGDLQAHVGCLRAAEQEMQRAAEKYGLKTLKVAMKQLQRYTETIVRKAIDDIPDGVYEGEDYADTDGFSQTPIKIKVALTVKGSEITVDYTGSDPVVKGAINSPFANTASATLYSLQFFLAPYAPQNEGMFNPIKLVIPKGTWLNAEWPAPTIGCTTLTSAKITSAIWQALAKARPDKVTGSTSGDCNWFVSSVKAPDGSTDVFSDLPAGGWGGTPYNDGMNVTEDPLGNCMNMPAETAELLFPIAYEAFELRNDSAGAGKFRGGLGAIFKVRFLCEGELSMETARTIEGSPGVVGGLHSPVQRQIKVFADGSREVIGGIDDNDNWHSPLLCAYPFSSGEQFVFESTGGGGYGDPLEREVGMVLEDVLDEYVSLEQARDLYGVVIDEQTMTVDEVKTRSLRSSRAVDNAA